MKTYKFVSWNVNGVRAVDKKEALKWVDEANIDILGLQEIKAQAEQIPASIFDKQYENVLVSSSAIKGRSGTALYTDIATTLEDNCRGVDVLDEGRINEAHFTLGDKDIAFFNVYFPNGQSKDERLVYKMEFYERFLNYCENLKKEGKSIIVCGDVSANMGDSMYDGMIFVGGEVKSLGSDCVEGEMNEYEIRWLEQKLNNAEINSKTPASKFKKYVAGKKLWNYDNLEPSERKGILG